MVKTKQGNKETTAAAKPPDRRLFRIMAFGDSNTFGTAAVAVPPSFRLATEDRWSRVMQSCLVETHVIDEGLPPISKHSMAAIGIFRQGSSHPNRSFGCWQGGAVTFKIYGRFFYNKVNLSPHDGRPLGGGARGIHLGVCSLAVEG